MRRPPAVASSFDPAQPDALKAEVARLLSFAPEPQVVKAVISPHAGLGYSGAVTGAV
jgi:MEMO1 family protein